MKLAARESGAARCAICHDDALDGPLVCPGCQTVVHAECRVGLPCPTLGCVHGPAPRRARVVVLRPPPWSALVAAARGIPRELALATLVVLGVGAAATAVHLAPRDVPATAQVAPPLVPGDPGGRSRRARFELQVLAHAAERFHDAHARWPERVDDLLAAGVLRGSVSLDPWGNAYLLLRRPDGAELLCRGPDGRIGGGDDLVVDAPAGRW